jgi:CheY-like chemotaxis protein
MNLVVNARDAMPTGGTLTISTADVDLSEHRETSVQEIEHWIRITVRDSGMGMNQDVMAHVFEPFFTTKAAESGTGIGLSITFGIVRHLGGTIRVASERGKGTTFEIDLPSVDCEGRGQPVSSTRPVATVAGATVLVVEDEPVLRRLISRILGKHGYSVISAGDGVEALAKAAAHSGTIDLVVTDVVMPRMGGVEMARALQAARPGIKTLFVSGYSTDEMVQRGMAADAPGFLAKPFTPDRFAKKVQELLDRGDEGASG